MASAYSCRPSELLHLTDPYDAFRLDRAVWIFGAGLKGELEGVKGKTDKEIQLKQDRVLRKWIPELKSEQKFREPPKEATR